MTRILILLTLAATINCTATELTVAQEATPTARQVLQKFVRVVGGYESLASISTMKLITQESGRSTVGKKASDLQYKTTMLRSDNQWIKINSTGANFGFDGSRCWMQRKDGTVKFLPKRRYPFDYSDPVSYPLHLSSFPGTVELAGKTKINGQPAYRLKVEPSTSEPETKIRMTPRELLFDIRTGLLLKIVHESRTIELGDYRKVDEVMVPHTQKVSSRVADVSGEYNIEIDAIEFNIEIEKDLLTPSR